MKFPAYMRVSKPYFKGDEIYCRVTVKWWGVFVVAWQTLTEEYEIPWYGWPRVVIVWIGASLKILMERKP